MISRMVTHRGIPIQVTDRDPLNVSQLCEFLHMSRWLYYRSISSGYVPEFGTRTTSARHYLAWLRSQARRKTATPPDLEPQLKKLR
jgi:hypothetical protein